MCLKNSYCRLRYLDIIIGKNRHKNCNNNKFLSAKITRIERFRMTDISGCCENLSWQNSIHEMILTLAVLATYEGVLTTVSFNDISEKNYCYNLVCYNV